MLNQQVTPNQWRPPTGELGTLQTNLNELLDLVTDLFRDPFVDQPTLCLTIIDSLLHLMTDVETQLATIREILEEERVRHNDWLLTESVPHD